MFRANEDSIVRSLEIIAECLVKQTKIVEQSMKKAEELRNYTIEKLEQNKEVIDFELDKEALKSNKCELNEFDPNEVPF